MSRNLCVAVVLSASLLTGAGPALAGMSEGVAAVTVGDYEKAISEFQPLAAAGDPAAQYQLAKIYLEGRGPADGVAQGVALMSKAANGGYPEAQAQLGLMYAMGLGVEVDNVQAHNWLTKAVKALPAGTRRTVAEANRDAVLKRMSAAEQQAIATAKPAMPAEANIAAINAKPAAVQEAAKTPATATTKTVTEAAATSKTTTTAAKATTTTTAKATTVATTPATTTKTVTEAAATNKTATTTAKATTDAAAASMAASTAKPAAADTKTPEKSGQAKPTQVASAKAPDAAPKAEMQKAAASGVRIQLVSMPSEEAAWSAWKQLSGKYASQLSGLTAMVEPADLGDKGTFYRVQTGPFQTVAAAQERCTAMKAAGLDCLVVGKP
jgi:cell division septation protein DedD